MAFDTPTALPADNVTTGSFGTTTSINPSFGSFFEVDPDNPSVVTLQIRAETDGTSNGQTSIDVDEDGDGTREYNVIAAFADPDAGSGYQEIDTSTLVIPAGGQFRVNNVGDPNGTNSIDQARAVVITPD
jgi:hypothetical protein